MGLLQADFVLVEFCLNLSLSQLDFLLLGFLQSALFIPDFAA